MVPVSLVSGAGFFPRWGTWTGGDVGSGGVGVGEVVSVLVLWSPWTVLAFEVLPARDVVARGGASVVILQMWGASFLFGPGFSSLVMLFPLFAYLGLVVVNEVSLNWGLYVAA